MESNLTEGSWSQKRRPEIGPRVREAAQQSYQLAGEEIGILDGGAGSPQHELPAGCNAFLLPRLRRLEWIGDQGSIDDSTRNWLQAMASSGLYVWALVPLEDLGKAHQEFRGIADRVQGWWVEGNRIHFAHPEWP